MGGKPSQQVYTVQKNSFATTNKRDTNLYGVLNDTNVAIGMHERTTRGLALLSYNHKNDFETEMIRARDLVDKLAASFKNPRIILVGLIPPFKSENLMLDALRGNFENSRLYVDDRTEADGDAIETKELVLNPEMVRIIARNMKGTYTNDSLVELNYSKIKR